MFKRYLSTNGKAIAYIGTKADIKALYKTMTRHGVLVDDKGSLAYNQLMSVEDINLDVVYGIYIGEIYSFVMDSNLILTFMLKSLIVEA